MRTIGRTLVGSLLTTLAVASAGQADVRVPSLIGDNMVLQQGDAVRLWGWAEPGEVVRASIAGRVSQATTGDDGMFHLSIGPLEPGGPYTLKIAGKNVLLFKNVLVGEVWIASGQSNMELPLSRVRDAKQEAAGATFPRVRLFTVPKSTALEPREEVMGEWVECRPDTVSEFSAVAYFFGRKLTEDLDIPIGLVHTSWGGTPAEAWTSREALMGDPALRPMVEELDRQLKDPNAEEAFRAATKEWEKKNVAIDPGISDEAADYARPDFDDAAWERVETPSTIESLGHAIDGAVWLRHVVQIPDAWAGKDLLLNLGAIDDLDVTYFAGQKVGSTGTDIPSYWTHQRAYKVPGELVKGGSVVIAVRVFDRGGDGGFMGPASEMKVAPADGSAQPLRLDGEWRLKIETAMGPFTPDWGSQPRRAESEFAPTTLYNAMIAPLTPMAIRGAIWYQGESNANRAEQYRTLFPTMIRNWRAVWGLGDFPFYYVQLANYMKRATEPGESDWAELREAQLLALAEPATGMAVIIDIGEANDIHPRNKQDVGARLARWALAKTYDRPVVPSGPLYRSHKVEGPQVRVVFDYAQGLVARGDRLVGFSIAGADKRFVWADARIDGETVVVSSPKVAAPVAVRYGWGDNPDVNLYNGAGLPASPFRTDR